MSPLWGKKKVYINSQEETAEEKPSHFAQGADSPTIKHSSVCFSRAVPILHNDPAEVQWGRWISMELRTSDPQIHERGAEPPPDQLRKKRSGIEASSLCYVVLPKAFLPRHRSHFSPHVKHSEPWRSLFTGETCRLSVWKVVRSRTRQFGTKWSGDYETRREGGSL